MEPGFPTKILLNQINLSEAFVGGPTDAWLEVLRDSRSGGPVKMIVHAYSRDIPVKPC